MTMTIHHIPVCPFCQRVEILLELKGQTGAVDFGVVDITKPRDPRILELTKGTTMLPVLEIPGKTALKESMVILRYLDEALEGPMVRREDPYEHALESLLAAKEGDFGVAGYTFVMNRDREKRDGLHEKFLGICREIDKLLRDYAPGETFFFDSFGWVEAIYTPLMQRFWFLDYYEGFEVPDDPDLARFKIWWEACRAHPAAQQSPYEEIVKLYYDYAQGKGNGALPEGREVSSFTFDPDWRDRPMPPADKWNPVGDAELGLL